VDDGGEATLAGVWRFGIAAIVPLCQSTHWFPEGEDAILDPAFKTLFNTIERECEGAPAG
jgi:hypothetical protein